MRLTTRSESTAGAVVVTLATALAIAPLFALIGGVALMWLFAVLHEYVSPAVPAIGFLPAFLISCCVAWFRVAAL